MRTAIADAADLDAFDPFGAGELSSVYPTSEAQREVWLADRLSPQASLAFNESVTLRLRGPLDLAALRLALEALLARHDALRTTFSPDGAQQLVTAHLPLNLPVVDLRDSGETPARLALERAATHEVQTRFDLERGPVWRATLYRLAERDHALLMTAHHIVCDGWSWGVLAQDLGALYAERMGQAPSPEPAPQYCDYVRWEIAQADEPDMRNHERYWAEQFSGSLPVLELPLDRPRPAVRHFDSRRLDHPLRADLVAALAHMGVQQGHSLFVTLLSGFAALLARLTGQEDVVVGVPAAGQAASGLSGLVGHCVNLLPIRATAELDGAFSALIRHCGERVLDAFDHQELAYGALLRQLPVARDPRRMPLVSVMFNLDASPEHLSTHYPDLEVQLQGNPRRHENFELFLNAVPQGGGLRLECQYNTALFDEATGRTWLGAYECLLEAAAAEPDTPVAGLPCLSLNAMGQLQALQPPPVPRAAGERMHTAFERQCARTPQAMALADSRISLRYAELDARANRLARCLRTRGVGRGARVGLCVSRGADMVVALLAILKAGGTYVPLDPGFPADRLAYYAEDAQLALLVLDGAATATAPTAWRADAADRLLRLDDPAQWAGHGADPLPPGELDATPDSAAYVIYTSGSTGRPKGVAVPHAAVVNFIASMQREPGLGAGDCLAAVTTLSFDIAVLEWLLPLSVGARVLVLPREVVMDGARLRERLEAEQVSAMQATPSLWRMLLETSWTGGPRFKALVGGEPFPPDLAQALMARCGEVWNLYGPTETTIWSTVWRVESHWLRTQGMSIGRPIANTTVWILDARGQPCLPGVAGEIWIGGAGVALGYVDRPELTAERFVDDPFSGHPGARLYRTGDRGRWHSAGLLEHLGRLDFQVKVRGYRIELGEIESHCTGRAGVGASVVLAREDHPGDTRLVAYLVPAAGNTVDEDMLRAHLRRALPEYMLPQHLLVLPALPLLPNGKIDRRALPAPGVRDMRPAQARIAPHDALQAQVLQAMEAVLNLPGLGIEDNFFALGGHSLLAARLTARLNQALGLNLPLSTLFEAPTAERLAQAVQALRAAGGPARAPLVARAERRTAPLTPMQARIAFVQDMHPDRVLYNTPSGHRLRGPMDVNAFEAALQDVIARQDSLRIVIRPGEAGNPPLQVVLPSLDWRLPLEDLSALAPEAREGELLRRMQQVVDRPIPLHEAPLFRAVLYRLHEQEHALLFMPHHIVWDGWSFDLLYEELATAYAARLEGRASPLPPLAVQYGDHAAWYLGWLEGPQARAQLAHWQQRYALAPAPRAPWTDHPRRSGMTGTGATVWLEVSQALTERLREVAREHDATLNMLCLAAYTALMADVYDSPALVVGIPVRGRMMAEVEPVMGFFNNLLPLPLSVDARQGWPQFVQQVRAELLQALAHQDIAFERLALLPELAAKSQGAGLYQVLFSFQDARERTRRWGHLQQEQIALFQKGATEDMGLWLMETGDGLTGGFTYNADLYTADTARLLHERFLDVLEALAARPRARLADTLEAASPAAAGLRALRSRAAARVQAVERPAAQAPQVAGGLLADLLTLWQSVLGLPHVGPDDHFFDLGGNSMKAMQMLARLEAQLGRRVRPPLLLEAPTPRELAAALEQRPGARSLVRLRGGHGRPPVFFVHDADGEVLLYRNLAQRLDPAHVAYGLQPCLDEGQLVQHTRIDDMVRHYIDCIRSVQPHGPYLLAGLCAGGAIAFELARQLQAQGETVATLALFDAVDIDTPRRMGPVVRKPMARVAEIFRGEAGGGDRESLPQALTAFAAGLTAYLGYRLRTAVEGRRLRAQVRALDACRRSGSPPPERLRRLTVRQVLSCTEHALAGTGSLRGDVVLFRASQALEGENDTPFIERYADPDFGWGRRVLGRVQRFDVSGGHSTMLQEPHVARLASTLQALMEASLANEAGAPPTNRTERPPCATTPF